MQHSPSSILHPTRGRVICEDGESVTETGKHKPCTFDTRPNEAPQMHLSVVVAISITAITATTVAVAVTHLPSAY